jgi:hypothetical protein
MASTRRHRIEQSFEDGSVSISHEAHRLISEHIAQTDTTPSLERFSQPHWM